MVSSCRQAKQKLLVIIGFGCLALLFILVFAAGYFILGNYLSEPFPGIRGGMILLLLAGGAVLVTFAIYPPFPSHYLVPLYLIAIIAGGYLYQLALLREVTAGASLIRSLYYLILLLGVVFLVLRKPIGFGYILFFIGWLLCNIFSIMGDNAPNDVVMLFLLSVVLPGFFALTLYSYFKTRDSLFRLSDGIAVGVVGLLAGLVVLMFLATVAKNYGSITLARNASDLNYAAGLIFLGWPFIFWRFNSRSILWKVVITAVILSACVFSFSRAVFFLGLFLAVITFLKPSILLRKQFILVVVVLVIAFTLFVPDEVTVFWLGRLNINSWADLISFNPEKLAAITATDRPEIWSFALKSFFESPIIGHGLGSFPTLISNETGGMLAYSGAHNLVLTVLVERGLLSAIFVAGMLIYIWFNLFRLWWSESGVGKEFFFLATISFTCFMVAAHSLGIELMRPGTMYVDSTISILLMVYLGILLSWKTIGKDLHSSKDGT